MKVNPGTGVPEAKAAVEAKEALVEALRSLHEEHGFPSLRVLESELQRYALLRRKSDGPSRGADVSPFAKGAPVSATTLSRILGGKSVPRWNVLVLLLQVFGVADQTIKTEWRDHWLAAKTGRVEKPRPQMELTPAAGPASFPEGGYPSSANKPAQGRDSTGCMTCGAVIADNEMDRHLAWHYELDQQLQQLRRIGLRAVD
jgi:hypothetical protein